MVYNSITNAEIEDQRIKSGNDTKEIYPLKVGNGYHYPNSGKVQREVLAVTQVRHTGKVRFYNINKGFGFVA